ncbi:cell wall metabolism sensor histidine kinase WalK [Microbacterium sp. MPKO10]|uniref:sensor histidine kinase n=1 Tax=Microbacterium sp. MPKO10 TaxID=2989818 RepID=UPI0022367C39|nr:HAMP domain-containing sensor histidine kinase [Microbacterium sp. MPKO10]MCW4456875.1 HAMP domain-containing histidine kinase [Microbacterium sp. MPKO10]
MTERRRGVTARTRILAWILLLVTIAIVAIVVVTGRSLFSRADSQVAAELAHEADKFRAFATKPDPSTGKEFFTVRELLTSHLQHNLAEDNEMFFSIIDGVADRRSGGERIARIDTDPEFVREAASVTTPTSGSLATEAGPVEYAIIPVSVDGDPATGQLVIAEFLAPEYDEAWSTIWVMSVVALVSLMLAGVTGWFIAGRVLAPIRDVRLTAARITETDLGRRIDVVGHDDVAQLAVTFNRMLDRLEAAFAGQRRFLDDAGHELRTPITVIRGHLDVMSDDPEDREQTMHLVDDELERMSRLVDDLIMLARSERPDFLLMGPTDVTDLVVETFAKATALAERHWSIDETPETFAVADAQRLTQALLQLAANAVAHTSERDSIALGGHVADDRMLLWVRDTGTGIPDDDRERIFERFARGSSETRRQGTGLGLAIVARIAEAHGGTVRIDSTPGHGATFTLDLPWIDPKELP